MITQVGLVLTVGGTIAVLMWLVAFGLHMRYMLRPEEMPTHHAAADVLTRIGLLLGAASWGSYAMLAWSQLPWRAALLPPVALVALVVQTNLARRSSMPLMTSCLYGCAVAAYSVALAALWIGNAAETLAAPSALLLVAVREIAGVTATGALLAYGALSLVKGHNIPLAQHLGDGMMRVALVAVILALSAAAWRAWSAWGEVARVDVAALFIAWSFLMAASLRQMMTGITLARIGYGLALLSLAALLVTLVLIP